MIVKIIIEQNHSTIIVIEKSSGGFPLTATVPFERARSVVRRWSRGAHAPETPRFCSLPPSP